jgi:O-antigen/teichoic acid export membrane protein
VAWLERLLYLPKAVGPTLFPRVAAAREDGSRDLVLKSGRHAFGLVLIIGLIFGLVARPMFRLLYGEAFDASVPALYALLPGVVMLAVFQVYSVALAADGRPGIGAWASGLAFPLNLGLNMLWIPRLGIVGAGLATTVSYSIMAVIAVLAFRRRHGVSLREMLVLSPAEAWNTIRRLRGGFDRNG